MNFARWSVSLVAIVGVFAVTVAGAIIWLLVTDPVGAADTTAKAVSTGDLTPVVQAIGQVIVGALRGLFEYL